jgi:hypothetical protein
MKVIPRGSDPERRHKIKAAHEKKDANDSVINIPVLEEEQ